MQFNLATAFAFAALPLLVLAQAPAAPAAPAPGPGKAAKGVCTLPAAGAAADYGVCTLANAAAGAAATVPCTQAKACKKANNPCDDQGNCALKK